ncbi:TetR/AcrR family transcriptional regulator [Parashewanella spongiae]|uniref:TetR/AcrR family transcriptional regulator n=1 Tax=Parashewanella spongiae TaxID=342950 RepID=A0A3A6TCX1_9GAMM|nr:TetR/AcrR family transcriptional regulator [Parashewanella spongiae]MCL1077069.1 TetR/AcrR family transcriptional regulator [Parashewanella spongiae]RJY10452.1 TetR/AcrR family transcriptional regulator [Parashewanella spongiae]
MALETPLNRSEQKNLDILIAAIKLFCENGFPHTSMDEVAKEAGVSKQTVYSHFGSKNDLFVAAIESKCLSHQLSDGILDDAHYPEKCLASFATHFGEMIVSPEVVKVFKACTAQSDTHPELSKLFFDAGPKHVIQLLSNYLIRVESVGEYHFPDAHHCAIRLCLMLFGELRLKLELGLEVEDLLGDREQYLKESAAMFLRAYKK